MSEGKWYGRFEAMCECGHPDYYHPVFWVIDLWFWRKLFRIGCDWYSIRGADCDCKKFRRVK